MPSWRKVIISGSDAALNSLFVSNGITGSLLGTASYANNLGGFDSTYFVDITSSQTIDGQKTILQPLSLGQYGATNGKLFFYGVDTGNKLSVESTGVGDLTFVDQTGSVLATLYQDGTGFELNAGDFRGNLTGTASFADTASVAISASYAPSTPAFPYTGSAQITGSLGVTGSINASSTTTTFLTAGLWSVSSNTLFMPGSSNGFIALTGNRTLNFTNSAINAGLMTMDGNTQNTLIGNSLTNAVTAARLVVRGSGTTNATTTLRIENNAQTASLIILDNNSGSYNGNFQITGSLTVGPSSINSAGQFVPGAAAGSNDVSSGTWRISTLNTGNHNLTLTLQTMIHNPGSGESTTTRVVPSISNSGTGIVNAFAIVPIVSQSVGATGATRGLYVNPTLTSAASWRSIEWSNNIGWGIYGSGSAQNLLRGNLHIGSFVTASNTLSVAGTTRISGSLNTATGGTVLTVIGSGSGAPIFTVQGSQGELFSVTDNLSGSLFSVNDISGLPILEVFSDNTILMGDYQDPMLLTTKKITQTNSGSFIVYSIPTASYDGAFIDYTIKSGSNARAGSIMSTWAGTSIEFTEVDTMDIGSTAAVGLTMILSGSNAVMTGSSSTGSWTIRTIIRTI